MKRREFVALLGGAAAWPIAARAQQGELPVVGMLISGSGEFLRSTDPHYIALNIAFSKGLEEAGFVEGRNLIIESRWAEGQYDRLPALAADLVRQRVNVIVANGGPAALSAKAATSTIPIVFLAGDPVKLGLVATVNRPGGNVTGVSSFSTLIAKRLELLRELVPGVATIAFLMNPANKIRESDAGDLETAARSVRQQIILLNASTDQEIDAAITTAAQRGVGALIVSADPFFNARRDRLAALATRYKIPASVSTREFAVSGGLISYVEDRRESLRWVGNYAGRILKGERPADLPIMLPTKFELVINLKTAKAIGLEVPPLLLSRADEVIE
jgi:putative ABC transport system substrate-binding protein